MVREVSLISLMGFFALNDRVLIIQFLADIDLVGIFDAILFDKGLSLHKFTLFLGKSYFFISCIKKNTKLLLRSTTG